jgi:hypothetical protein
MNQKSEVKKAKKQKPENQSPIPEEPTTTPETTTETALPETTTPPPETTPPEPESPPAPTMESLHREIESIKLTLTELQDAIARKRRSPSSNGKVQIRDKQTGNVYPSKNNAYQTLLKSGELKELVDKGLFGDIPQKNTFGWYVLHREWPDRFEEVHPEAKQA